MATASFEPRPPLPRRRLRWVWAALLAGAAVLAMWSVWGASALAHALALNAGGLDSPFDVTVNGLPGWHDGWSDLLGGALAVAVIGGVALVAVAVLLPMALGAVLVGVLVIAGLVLGVIALPVLLVLALLLSPVLLLGGLAWMLFG